MKRIVSLVSIGVIIMIALFAAQPAKAQVRFGASISFQNFYDELSPYGDWIDYPDYGYTWRPRLGGDFRPYATNGYWSYADGYDWTWVSDYDWGWAPFHYGRWLYDPYYGWLWVPGYEWAPAWVAWRGGGDYYGWAPLRPGFNISFGFDNYNTPYDYWTFAPCNYMTSRHISRYYYPYRNNMNIFNRTVIINNYDRHRGGRDGYYRNGPSRHEVERYTGRIDATRVREMDRPGRNSVRRDELSIYRPAVNRNSNNNNDRYAPKNVRSYDRDAVSNRGDINNGRGSGRDNGNYGRENNRNNIPDRNRANDNIRNAERGQREGQVIQQREVNNERNTEARQRATEMRQRNDQVQREQMRQRDVENQRAVERQRNEQYQREQQRQDQARIQRDQESQRRVMDNRRQQMEQERVQRDNQRSTEIRQRNEETQRVQQQRESQRQQTQVQQQREIRSRETQVERPSRDLGGRENSGGDRGSRQSGRGRF